MEELTLSHKHTLLTLFYLGKLEEFGLITGGDYKMTVKGFDIALDLYNSGLKVPADVMHCIIISLLDENGTLDAELLNQFTTLSVHLQDIGVDEMKKEIKKYGE